LVNFAQRQPYASPDYNAASAAFLVQEKAFASTSGSYCTQRLYRTEGIYSHLMHKDGKTSGTAVDVLSPAGMGWELFRDQPLRELMQRAMEQTLADMALPEKPIDVGRYDVVLGASGIANILSQSIGSATQLDRALGYEANAGGTSYLIDPFEMLHTYKIGTPLLNVSANRDESGAANTVKWDDEGVAPDRFTLVKDGILADFSTTREAAGWLRDSYTRANAPVRSHGCAYAPSAVSSPLAHTPNLTMLPGSDSVGFDELVSTMVRGMAFRDFKTSMDFQQLNGFVRGSAFEVKNGKRVANIPGAGILFRTPEFWKGVSALGGQSSARRYGIEAIKGEPPQRGYHSVTAVPVLVKDMTVIDPFRKA